MGKQVVISEIEKEEYLSRLAAVEESHSKLLEEFNKLKAETVELEKRNAELAEKLEQVSKVPLRRTVYRFPAGEYNQPSLPSCGSEKSFVEQLKVQQSTRPPSPPVT